MAQGVVGVLAAEDLVLRFLSEERISVVSLAARISADCRIRLLAPCPAAADRSLGLLLSVTSLATCSASAAPSDMIWQAHGTREAIDPASSVAILMAFGWTLRAVCTLRKLSRI